MDLLADKPPEIQVEFEFFDPRPDDEAHIRALLSAGALANAAPPSVADTAALAKLLAEQPAVGTLVKADQNLFAFLSAVSLIHQRALPLVAALTDWLLAKATPQPSHDALARALEPTQPAIGLVVSERMLNTPPELIPDAYDSLLQDISWAVENEETAQLRESFRFARLLFLANVSVGAADTDGVGNDGAKRPSKKVKRKAVDLEGLSFARAEEEVFANLAEDHALIHGANGVDLLAFTLSMDSVRAAVPALRDIM